jgi:hypothetical protein
MTLMAQKGRSAQKARHAQKGPVTYFRPAAASCGGSEKRL